MSPKKRKDYQQDQKEQTDESFKPVFFNIRKARHEVKKFVISGLKNDEKEDAKMALAISLGAKPPKNKFKNYKELLAQKKKTKLQAEASEALREFQYSSSKHKKRKRDRNDVAAFDSQIGKYCNGAQVIRKHEIHRIKKRRR